MHASIKDDIISIYVNLFEHNFINERNCIFCLLVGQEEGEEGKVADKRVGFARLGNFGRSNRRACGNELFQAQDKALVLLGYKRNGVNRSRGFGYNIVCLHSIIIKWLYVCDA